MTTASPSRIPVAAVDREHAALRNALESAVAEVFRRARFILGPEVEAFESELAEIFADMADNVARATGPWLTVTA